METDNSYFYSEEEDYSSEPEHESERSVVVRYVTIFLIVAYFGIPLILISLWCFVFENIPKKDLWFFFCSITSYSWIFWLIIIFGTNLICTKDCSPFVHADYGGFAGEYSSVVVIILIIISFMFTFIFDMAYSLCDIPSSLFEPMPAGDFRDILDRIQAAGPSLTAGLMVETSSISNKGNKTSWWGRVDWASFPYRSWANINTPHPYFHDDQDCQFNFEDLEEVFNYPKAVIIKTTLDVVPANEQTKENYESWKTATIRRITTEHSNESGRDTKEFVEELVTDEKLASSHEPNHLIPSIQLPALVTNQAEHMLYSHMMEARDRSAHAPPHHHPPHSGHELLLHADEPCLSVLTSFIAD